MSIVYFLEDRTHNTRPAVVHDLDGLLINLILRTASQPRNCPRLIDYINVYGDTIFNSVQADKLIEELDELSPFAIRAEEKAIIAQVKKLIVECKTSHKDVYLLCEGD